MPLTEGMFVITLRPFTKTDIKPLIGWVGSPEFLVQWAGSGLTYPLDEPQIENLLLQTQIDEARIMMFKAVEEETQETIGHVELSNIDRKNRSAGVARVLVGPERLRGKGLGTEIMRGILKLAFQQMKLHRVYLHVFDSNQHAIRCYEKAGFRREGLLRDTHKVGDRFWSVYVMSILESEWKS